MNRIEELYNDYKFIDLSMGLNVTSLARYLITHCGANSIIYGGGIRGSIIARMLREREGIIPEAVIDRSPQNEFVEGIPCIQRDSWTKKTKVAFVAVEAYKNDKDNTDIRNYLDEIGVELVLDMNPLVLRCVYLNFYGYFVTHKKDFIEYYDIFEDELSRDTYYHYIKAILTGEEYRGKEISEKYKYWGGGEDTPLFRLEDEIWVNFGACLGDTIGEFLESDVPIDRIFAIEGNWNRACSLKRNIGLLPQNVRNKISIHNAFVGNGYGEISLDELVKKERITLINMDIEGAEIPTLESATYTIKTYHPVLAICAYHKPDDIFAIINLAKKYYSGYKFYFRKYFGTGGRSFFMGSAKLNEFVLYAVPDDRIVRG